VKTPRTPATPDPAKVSAAQTQSNQQTAAYQNALEHGNVSTPYGSQTFTGRVDPTTGATVYDQNITLAPDQQKLVDMQSQQDLAVGQVGNSMLDNISQTYGKPVDTSQLPALQGSVSSNPLQTSVNGGGQIQNSVNPDGPALQGSLDRSQLPQLYGADDLEGSRQKVSDALYQRQTAYLDPQYAQADQAMRTRLANQGITEGSEAWKNAIDEYDRGKAFSYGQARDSSIAGGLSEMQGLSGIASQNRGQLYNEELNSGNFTNAARAQALQEALARGQFGNEAQQQEYSQNLASGQFANDAEAQRFGQEMQAGQFTNNARTQGMNEQLALRNQPLNEYSALRSASQVNMPQFQNPQNAQVAPTDTSGDIWNAYNGAMNSAALRSNSNGNFMSGLMNLGGQLGSAWISSPQASDERVKSEVEQVGELTPELGLYEYEYTGDPLHERQRGVMAHEVERVDPHAVVTDEDGVKRVDYSRVIAHALARRRAA
jgi:hypothetical protein